MSKYTSSKAPLARQGPGMAAPADGNVPTLEMGEMFRDGVVSLDELGHLKVAATLGANFERLEEARPELVNALRELVRQYREEGVVARRHEIRRVRQARMFWQGLQYAWWNPSDMNWHLPFEQKFSDDRSLEEMPRYQFVTNFYQGFGLSFVAVISQDVPSEERDPYLYETLTKIVSAVNAASANSGVDPANPSPAPPPIAGVAVQAGNGWFDLAITDPAVTRPGLFYFAESDVTPAFSAPRVYFLGASRNLYVQLGNQTLYWRAYSQYVGSLASAAVTFGTPPTAVVGGGASGPAPLASRGSGALPNGLLRGGNGFGVVPGARVVKTTVL